MATTMGDKFACTAKLNQTKVYTIDSNQPAKTAYFPSRAKRKKEESALSTEEGRKKKEEL